MSATQTFSAQAKPADAKQRMKAVAVFPGQPDSAHLADMPKPSLDEVPAGRGVLVKVLRVGVDGTDKEINAAEYGAAPPGYDFLVIGHEGFGRVEAVGPNVTELAPGDHVVATVRRPGSSIYDVIGTNDMTTDDTYFERGINLRHGYLAEYYVDDAAFIVKIPQGLKDVGVLLEPTTVVEKGIAQAYEIQRRLRVWHPRKAAVVGAGTIGLLAAMVLRLEGIDVTVFGRTPRPYLNSDLIEALGARYETTTDLPLIDGAAKHGPFDLIFECTGFSPIVFEAMQALGKNGVLVLSSVTGGDRRVEVPADAINLGFVLGNKVMVGTVNANREYFEMGVKDMAQAEAQFPGWLGRLLTHPVHGLESFPQLFDTLTRGKNVIKAYCQVAGSVNRADSEDMMDAERTRLAEDATREKNWKRWGPYLSERQWGTVREDYSAHGECWTYFPHDHARSRVYRWGEDGLLGVCDRECRLCFSVALWNGKDPILKERLFGLTGPEGNHGEDVKELYYYLDSTPTHSYMKALYKYPHAEFPYARLVEENARRGKDAPEFELLDTGVFDDDRYFDVTAEYAKASTDDLLIRLTVANRGPEAAVIHLLPQTWFRNTWSWGRTSEGYGPKPKVTREADGVLRLEHGTLGSYRLVAGLGPFGRPPALLVTDNETNMQRVFGSDSPTPFVKDAFHDYVVGGRSGAVNPARVGTKAAAYYRIEVPARGQVSVRLRLTAVDAKTDGNGRLADPLGHDYEETFDRRIREADEFYGAIVPDSATDDERNVIRQGYAGLLWSKQFFYYVVKDWLEGDPSQPPPPPQRRHGRNCEWTHFHARDVLSMPDKWEYPWFAAWDLAFHMIPFAQVDPEFAKQQLVLMLREWYTHGNGQLPAYEFAFDDVNPPVHAWACWRVYKMSGARGDRDRIFLERVFQKLLINFTWWVNRKDVEGHNLFGGGFLGLDNIGVFDRSQALPTGGHLEQADGTAWMAFYCSTMLSMALELASEDPAYEDVASKFFEHFVAIVDSMNVLGGTGLWNEQDGFYYDQLNVDGHPLPLQVRTMVGLIPLFAVENLEMEVIQKLPGFKKRLDWFLENRADLARHISYMKDLENDGHGHRLLAIPSRERLQRLLTTMLDEREFLSPHGLRAMSRIHAEHPYHLRFGGQDYRVEYEPAESNTGLFGGNSNWRGPIWMPLNYLIVESLERYHHFYGDALKVECPTGSGRLMTLKEVSAEIGRRLGGLFLRDAEGRRPCHGDEPRYARDPHFRDLVLFNEYFHGDNGRGVGASHQTGWTALAVGLIEDAARSRAASRRAPEVTRTAHEHAAGRAPSAKE